jgi:DNA-binding protein H-NS
MTESTSGEAPVIATPRLVFDDTSADIPDFLKQGVPEMPRERAIKSPTKPDTIIEPTAPAKIITPSNGAAGESETVPSLDDMSIEDLRRQQEEIDRKIREKTEAEKRAVIEQIVQVVNTYNIPIEEIVEALGGLKIKRKGVKAQPKYRDPATGTLWSGRGKEPAWIKGKDRKAFLIE